MHNSLLLDKSDRILDFGLENKHFLLLPLSRQFSSLDVQVPVFSLCIDVKVNDFARCYSSEPVYS